MDLTTATVETIKAIVWPVTTLWLVFMLRSQIADLVTTIREGKLKYKDLELAISRDLREVKANPDLEKISNTEDFVEYAGSDPLVELAHTSPRAAILESWIRLEEAARSFIERKGSQSVKDKRRPLWTKLQEIHRTGDLAESYLDAFNKLRDVRNKTAHSLDYHPTSDDAEEFVIYALALEYDLNNEK